MDQQEKIASFYDIRGENVLSRGEFALIAPSFATPYNFAHKEILERLSPGSTVLDFACGTGIHSVRLAQNGFKVVGVDLSKRSIEAAETLSKDLNIDCSFYVGDHTIPEVSEQRFDAIFVSGALYYLELEFFSDWFNNHLKDGGVLVAIETLGNNWLLGEYRRLKNITSGHRDEETLNQLWTKDQFNQFGNPFKETNIYYFDLLTLMGRLFKSVPSIEKLYCKLAGPIDYLLLNYILNQLAFKVVLICEKGSR